VNRTTTVYLTGGGPGSFTPLRRHLKSAVAEIAVAAGPAKGRAPLVAYVGAASADHAGFFRMIRAAVEGATKARMRLAKLASRKAKASEARGLLDDCDLVFVSGGDVEHGMRVLHDRDMVEPLRSLAGAGKPMFGISAGSLMLAQDWVRFPDEDSAKAELFPCLGIAPIHVDAHAEEDEWEELRVLVHLLGRRGRPQPVGHGLTRGGGLRLEVAGDKLRARAIGTPIPRIVLRRGKVVDARPLVPASAKRPK
jgi:peptidase E